jgi:diguanylate cyclase (GGDEF)-like protein
VSPPRRSLLIVDDEPYILPTLVALLSPYYDVITADSADSAEIVFRRRKIELILTDQKMPRRTGIQLLEWVRENSPQTVRLLMTGYAELEDAVEAINRGHVYYYLLKPWRTEELLGILRNASEHFALQQQRDELLQNLQELNRELEQRVTERTRDLEIANRELQQQAVEMERLALTDPLTGLFNRRAVDGLALAEVKRHARYHNSLALGIIDVDHFKQINTNYQLTGGDATLIGLGRLLTATMRETDSVGRVGGEEFLVIARETNEEGARILAERIRARVETTPIEYHDHRVAITVSIGFSVAEGATQTQYPQLYEEASAALNQAKHEGRNRCVVRRLPG